MPIMGFRQYNLDLSAVIQILIITITEFGSVDSMTKLKYFKSQMLVI